jgi:monofunctional biosynthetic peptidoglycan transglycosylase
MTPGFRKTGTHARLELRVKSFERETGSSVGSLKKFKTPGFGSWVAFTALLSVFAGTAVIWGGYLFFRSEFPDVTELSRKFPVAIYKGRGKPFEMTLRTQRPAGWTPLSQVSKLAIGAVIVSEDWSFYSHKGYDPVAIREAIVEDIEAGGFVRGASTLTQQVAKNVFLERDKTLWRKLREFWLAIELEEKVGKRRILEAYFNVAEWGEGVFGIRAAARHYFGKAPSELNAREAAFLAMLLPSPKKYSVSHRQGALTRYARRTVHSILHKMLRARYLSQSEYEGALASRMGFERKVASLTDDDQDEAAGPDEQADEPASAVATTDGASAESDVERGAAGDEGAAGDSEGPSESSGQGGSMTPPEAPGVDGDTHGS